MAQLFSTRFTGARSAIRELEKLPSTIRRKILRNAFSAGAGVIKRSMKTGSPRETGLLSRSWKVSRFKLRRDGTGRITVLPNRKLVRVVRRTAKGKLRATSAKVSKEIEASASVIEASVRGQKIRRRRPANYAYPLEVRDTAAKGFAKKAFNRAQASAAQRITEKLREGILAEARKSNARTKRSK